MKIQFKVFELVEVSTLDQWGGEERTHFVARGLFEFEEFLSEEAALFRIKEDAEAHPLAYRGNTVEIRKVLVL